VKSRALLMLRTFRQVARLFGPCRTHICFEILHSDSSMGHSWLASLSTDRGLVVQLMAR
jgi:hypothetical protein